MEFMMIKFHEYEDQKRWIPEESCVVVPVLGYSHHKNFQEWELSCNAPLLINQGIKRLVFSVHTETKSRTLIATTDTDESIFLGFSVISELTRFPSP